MLSHCAEVCVRSVNAESEYPGKYVFGRGAMPRSVPSKDLPSLLLAERHGCHGHRLRPHLDRYVGPMKNVAIPRGGTPPPRGDDVAVAVVLDHLEDGPPGVAGDPPDVVPDDSRRATRA